MSNYVKATNFYSKDALLTGNPDKIIKGAEIDDEFNAIATAITTKADLNNPNFTGTPTVPTATPGTNTTQAASTAYVQALAATLGDMSTQDADDVDITGGSIVGITDLLPADGGTGVSSLTAKSVIIGGGINPVTFVAPGTEGNVLISDGTNWTSAENPRIGVNQTWQNVTGSRTAGTTYTNSTGKPIMVTVTAYKTGSTPASICYVDGVQVAYIDGTGTNDVGIHSTSSFIVPDESTYQVSYAFEYWSELR